jgi:ketosteroid isomerase-like protein
VWQGEQASFHYPNVLPSPDIVAKFIPQQDQGQVTAMRSESAKLMAVRRSRQLPGSASASRAEVGSIDVQIVGLDVAIAAYTYSFNTHKIRADGTKVRLTTTFGRATQIFQRSEDSALRIVHEHLSAAAAPAVEKAAE